MLPGKSSDMQAFRSTAISLPHHHNQIVAPMKRRNSSSASSLEDLPSPKKSRPDYVLPTTETLGYDDDGYNAPSTTASAEQPRLDPMYGMRGAFPGLDDHLDELFYGPASDGLEYLRMVR